jgi:hypothetical protein
VECDRTTNVCVTMTGGQTGQRGAEPKDGHDCFFGKGGRESRIGQRILVPYAREPELVEPSCRQDVCGCWADKH